MHPSRPAHRPWPVRRAVLLFPLLVLAVSVAACGDLSEGDAAAGVDGRDGNGVSPGSAAAGSSAWAGTELDEPLPRPDFTLTDTRGRPFDFRAETAGRLTLLFFGYTHCPDVCPVHMANLAAALRDLPRESVGEVEVVFVTTDPARDTPERIRSWLDRFHPDFVGLRGSRKEVNAIEERLALPRSVVDGGDTGGGDYFVGHAAQVLAFQADDTARVAYPWGTRQRDWLRDLPRLAERTSSVDGREEGRAPGPPRPPSRGGGSPGAGGEAGPDGRDEAPTGPGLREPPEAPGPGGGG